GVFVGAENWTWIFWFGAALAAVCFTGAALTLTESSDPVGRRLDVPGLATGAAAIMAATFAVIEGENRGYRTWWIVLLFAAAAALVAVFVLVEQRVPDPVFKLRFLRDPTFTAANVVAFATNLSVFSVFFFTALYLQLISSFSGFQIALVFVSLAAAMIVSGPLAGRWTARSGARTPMVLGCLLAGAGLLLVDWKLTATTTVAALSWPLAIAGLGFGIALVTMSQSVLTLVRPQESGLAASTVNTSRELGGVFGVAVLGSVVNAQLTGGLTAKLIKLHIPQTFRQLVIQIVTTGGSTNAADYPIAKGHAKQVQQVFNAAAGAAGHGIHLSLQIGAAIVLAAAVIALFAARHRVSRA
ncbi:MAG TPA: MFS transporter, partial [Gaiellaceae bacterium]|nr:MFS transporter [Gaiellaceae bacterium]